MRLGYLKNPLAIHLRLLLFIAKKEEKLQKKKLGLNKLSLK